jgi:hypothetical protein
MAPWEGGGAGRAELAPEYLGYSDAAEKAERDRDPSDVEVSALVLVLHVVHDFGHIVLVLAEF